jgi:hypothetical protein
MGLTVTFPMCIYHGVIMSTLFVPPFVPLLSSPLSALKVYLFVCVRQGLTVLPKLDSNSCLNLPSSWNYRCALPYPANCSILNIQQN